MSPQRLKVDNVEKGHQELVPRMAKSGTVLRADFRVVTAWLWVWSDT